MFSLCFSISMRCVATFCTAYLLFWLGLGSWQKDGIYLYWTFSLLWAFIFLVICVSIHNTTSMQTSFESMFMLPQITAHLSHEHPYAPVEMTSYQCQLLCAHINIDDLGFLQASRKKCQTEFKHSGGSEGQFLQFLCLVRSCHDSESVLCSAPPFLFH